MVKELEPVPEESVGSEISRIIDSSVDVLVQLPANNKEMMDESVQEMLSNRLPALDDTEKQIDTENRKVPSPQIETEEKKDTEKHLETEEK